MDDIKVAYQQIRATEEFQTELAELFAHYVGRPSPTCLMQNGYLNSRAGADSS